MKKCGVPFVTYHTLRHSFATHLAEKGKSMKDIAAYLGDDISTTEKHYIAFSPADDGVIDCL
jgi:site-specific recombinase XerD